MNFSDETEFENTFGGSVFCKFENTKNARPRLPARLGDIGVQGGSRPNTGIMYVLGEALLVRPVMEPDVQQVSVYLPGKNTVGMVHNVVGKSVYNRIENKFVFSYAKKNKLFQLWYNWDNRKAQPGPGALYVDTPMEKIPVFQRGGTIVVTKERIRRASVLMANDPITLTIALNNEVMRCCLLASAFCGFDN